MLSNGWTIGDNRIFLGKAIRIMVASQDNRAPPAPSLDPKNAQPVDQDGADSSLEYIPSVCPSRRGERYLGHATERRLLITMCYKTT